MSALAPTLQAFFTERLVRQRRASHHTIAAYRDTFRLLLGFVSERHGRPPSRLGFEDLDAAMITAFLDHLEDDRRMLVAAQAGLRVSELADLDCADVALGAGAYIRCHGKGRKERVTPLTTQTVAVLRVWMAERQGLPEDPLFPTRTGRRLTRDAIKHRVAQHAAVAATTCPSLRAKRVSPHVLRHSCAMSLLHSGIDVTVIALWLGHEDVQSTQMYVHADMTMKERALARTTPHGAPPGRYRAPDSLLAFLESL